MSETRRAYKWKSDKGELLSPAVFLTELAIRQGDMQMQHKCMNRSASLMALLTVASSCALQAAIAAPTLSQQAMENKDSAKSENIQEAQKLNGDAPSQKELKQSKSDGKTDVAKRTAAAVNQVPGVKVNESDLETPTQPPIKGFHPIKKLLRPVENLEGMSIKLEQQIMKLEGPIAGLQPPMINLQKKMSGVNDQIGRMESRLTGVQDQVQGTRTDLTSMRTDINNIRSDLKLLRADVHDLKGPIIAIKRPLVDVATPLEEVKGQLTLVLLAILVAALAIAIGTPLVAFAIYRHHRQSLRAISHDADSQSSRQPALSGRSSKP
jgi:septal ring factor EnvC (AmiA/AmiB activator)